MLKCFLTNIQIGIFKTDFSKKPIFLSGTIYEKNGALFGQSVGHLQDTVQQARAKGQPQILADFVPERPGEWAQGRIYDPNNKTYFHGTLTALDPHELKVYGYIGFSWLGGDTIWTRVSTN